MASKKEKKVEFSGKVYYNRVQLYANKEYKGCNI